MTEHDIARLIRLALVLLVIGGFWIFRSRTRPGTGLHHAGVWVLIFLAVIAGAGLWQDVRSSVIPRQAVMVEDGRIELPRAPDGHYYVALTINGTQTRFVVDTGATGVVLTRRDAERAGLDVSGLLYRGQANTANGAVRTAPVTLDRVALGPFEDRNLRAYVNEGEMTTSLLGMSYLQRFARLEISGGRMILER